MLSDTESSGTGKKTSTIRLGRWKPKAEAKTTAKTPAKDSFGSKSDDFCPDVLLFLEMGGDEAEALEINETSVYATTRQVCIRVGFHSIKTNGPSVRYASRVCGRYGTGTSICNRKLST